jgi:hypothetical protein
MVEERKSGIKCLGVAVVAIARLALEVSAKLPKTLAVCSTEQEGTQILIANSGNGKSTFGIGCNASAIVPVLVSSLILAARKVRTIPMTPTPHTA